MESSLRKLVLATAAMSDAELRRVRSDVAALPADDARALLLSLLDRCLAAGADPQRRAAALAANLLALDAPERAETLAEVPAIPRWKLWLAALRRRR